MSRSSRTFSEKFWEDKQGRVVVWQRPNKWLTTWFITFLLSAVLPLGWPSTTAYYISLLSLVVWAVLEAFRGVNYFRRTIGICVLLILGIVHFGFW